LLTTQGAILLKRFVVLGDYDMASMRFFKKKMIECKQYWCCNR